MKVEELMIGDWVMSNDLKTPIKICSIMNHYGTNIYFYHEASEYISNISKLEPIPLTPEILEKNGFNLNDEIDDCKLYDGIDNRVTIHNYKGVINSNNEWHIHIDNEDYSTIASCELTYVHELQHLLKLCGIEKEIIV